jgi:hypothetical protein
MTDPQKATEVSVLTTSTEPLTGIVQVNTAEAEIEFEITEDIAHKICIDLERFLTDDGSRASKPPGKRRFRQRPRE